MYTFDMKRLQPQADGLIAGEFVKYRQDHLPHVGRPTAEERELDIREDEFLIEKSYFLFEPARQLLVYQRNSHGASILNFERYFAKIHHEAITLFNPVLQPDPMQRLMRGEAMPRKLYLTVARPTNPELVPRTEWGAKALELLASSGGMGFTLQLRADGTSQTEERYLSGDIKRAVRELIECGAAKTAKIDLEEGTITHPIDLIADKLVSTQTVAMAGRYPLRTAILPALYAALEEKRQELDRIFGHEGNRLT
ncbi:DUF6731 family protein [Stutzerimonas balearica]|uniref:DUF6731 family protein n=1 Tax=Stutzerimonas balearica TaxID=74829 RepID=UPI0028AFD80A|nr:DUF6731 family protein [Stutzerimonas balearica]